MNECYAIEQCTFRQFSFSPKCVPGRPGSNIISTFDTFHLGSYCTVSYCTSCIACVTSSSGKSAASLFFFLFACRNECFQVDTMMIGDWEAKQSNATLLCTKRSDFEFEFEPKNFKRDKQRVGVALGWVSVRPFASRQVCPAPRPRGSGN